MPLAFRCKPTFNSRVTTPASRHPIPHQRIAARVRPLALSVILGTARYLRHKAMDLADFARDTVAHPGTLPQNLVGLVVSLGTFGGTRHVGPGTFVLYENARGLGAFIPGRAGHTAITFGNVSFSRKSCTQFSTLYWHEQTHHLQSIDEGWKWAFRYFGESRRHGYRKNRYEVEAYERGPIGAGSPVCEWRRPHGHRDFPKA